VTKTPLRPLVRMLLMAMAATLGGAHAGLIAEDTRDHMKIADQSYAGYIDQEYSDTIVYRGTQGGTPITKKFRQLKFVDYYGMHQDGPWRKGIEARTRGNYDEAAALFDQVSTGPHAWEQVYGAMAEGDCLDLAKEYAAAAQSYQKVAGAPALFTKDDAAMPRPRQWLDANYHVGMDLAQSDKGPDAQKIADGLSAYAQLNGSINSAGADSRANAIRAAVAMAQGDEKGFTNFISKVILDPDLEPDVWFHFNIYVANSWTTLKNTGNAIQVLRGMSSEPSLARHPANQAQIFLLQGLDLIPTDPTSALIDLLKIDVMPYSSDDQRLVARAAAGGLLIAAAAKIKDPVKDDHVLEFRKELLRTARLVLSSAADSSSHLPDKDKAKALLDAMGPDEDEPAPPAAAPAAPSGDNAAPASEPVGAAPAGAPADAPKHTSGPPPGGIDP
jgi:hypothetical protein